MGEFEEVQSVPFFLKRLEGYSSESWLGVRYSVEEQGKGVVDEGGRMIDRSDASNS